MGWKARPRARRRRAPGLDGPGFIARANLLAGAPRVGLAAQRQRVDPPALLVSDLFKAAVGPHRDDASIVAASEQRLAVADRCQHSGVGVDDDALLLIRLANQHGPIGQGQRWRAVNERRRYDMRARVK